ncbi:MAG: trypsin-like peptidase domain-containing protein [Acutalibacteraceae bacterium]|nr:trypsin-like peptidase domain-containing protein [Acutalibacteraceae bacterium]
MNNNFNDEFKKTENVDNPANANTTQSNSSYVNPYANNSENTFSNNNADSTVNTTSSTTSSSNTSNTPNINTNSTAATSNPYVQVPQASYYYNQAQSNPYSSQAANTANTAAAYGDSYTNPIQQPQIQPAPKKKNGMGKSLLKAIVIALCFGLVAGSTMVGVNYAGGKLLGSSSAASKNDKESTIKSTAPVVNNSGASTVTSDVSKVVTSVMPAMVSINIKSTATYNDPYSSFFGFGFGFGGGNGYEYETESSGSGIIISENEKELLIVTNNHVVEGANEISVCFADEKTSSATIKGTDPDYDLAVISVKLSDISEETKGNIAIATLGDSETLQLGQPAIAIGNALGYGQSVTVGYISALEREVQMTDKTMTLIQTDAAINPGNSGGALIDTNGSVIGINSAKYSDTNVEGMGYAIPISDASPIIDGLINQSSISKSEQAYLGILGNDVTDSYSQAFGLPTGVYVSKVNNSSPAEKAGIQAGDIIVEFDGAPLSTMDSLQSRIKSHKAGDEVEVKLKRQQRNGDYKDVTLTVVLEAKVDAPQQ